VKRLATISLLLVTLLFGQSDSLTWLDYFPHQIGDKWLYRVTGPYAGQEKLELVEVVGDTVMRNNRTYKHFRTVDYSTDLHSSQFFRIDMGIKSIFEYREVLDTLLCSAWEIQRFDFWPEIPFDTTLRCYGYQNCESAHYYYSICRDSGLAPIGIGTISAPYNTFTSTAIVESEFTFSKGFGLTYWHTDEILIIAGYLIAAEINGIHYGEPFATKPQPGLPVTYRLYDPYPNPFNSEQEIAYSHPRTATVDLAVYDVMGRPVKRLVSGVQPAGTYHVVWYGCYDTGETLPSGVYIYRLVVTDSAGTFDASKKLVLLK
jgi:hypothetical protein